MFTYAGNIHIHSLYSDGSGTIDEIAACAASAGLSYIIITDHETLDGLPEEGIRYGVVVLVGAELNRESHHYLALDLKQLIVGNEIDPQEMTDRVRRAGALGFMAHPFEKGSPYIDLGKSYPWIRFPESGFTGLELWNYTSSWRGRATSVLKTIYWFLFNRLAAVDGPPSKALALWDRYTNRGLKVTAIGGSDAHAARVRVALIPVEIFPYRFLFQTINTYLCFREQISSNFSAAKAQIYAALREGRCYISFDQLHSGKGFSFTASAGVMMGEETAWQEGIDLLVRCPTPRSEIRIIKNGNLLCCRSGPELKHRVAAPGVYRAEVHYIPSRGRPRPWIYANPIYIRD